MAITKITDVIVPEVFDPYFRTQTETKSRLVQSGALVADARLAQDLAGGGMTFNRPFWNDLGDDVADIVSDNEATAATPLKITAGQEVQIRLTRHQSWSSMNLAGLLAGSDPQAAIAARVGAYWERERQRTFISVMTGVFADNTANDAGDYTNDDSGGAFIDGVTNFTASGFIDTLATMGDSDGGPGIVMVHSTVYARMRKLDLIDTVKDSQADLGIETFMGRFRVIVDDGMPKTGNVCTTWVMKPGAVAYASVAPPDMPGVELEREPNLGNGGGQDILHTRVCYAIHPVGHAYTGATTAGGGPANTVLDDAASWNRVFAQRKQIGLAQYITREA